MKVYDENKINSYHFHKKNEKKKFIEILEKINAPYAKCVAEIKESVKKLIPNRHMNAITFVHEEILRLEKKPNILYSDSVLHCQKTG